MLGGIHGLRLGRIVRRASLGLALLGLASVLCPRPGHAIDAVDLAVDAFVVGGAAVGIPISPSEVKLVKPLVKCIAVEGKSPIDCTKRAIIEQLPEASRGLATCITGGTSVADCAQAEAFKRLPPQSQELAKCVAGGTDVAECGKKFATTQAEKAAFSTIDKLKGDAKDKFKDATSPLQNIVDTVDGIVREDWEKVLKSGGKAVAKYTIKAVISSLTTQVGSILTGPIIDTVVDNRIDLVADLIKAARTGNLAELGRIIAEFYLVMHVEIPCALIPAGAVKEAICGTVGKIIGAVGKGVGAVLGAIGDALDFLGGLAEDFIGLFDGKDDDCGTAQQYYANNFVTCYHRAAYIKGTDPAGYGSFEEYVYQTCRNHFKRCTTAEKATRVCDAVARHVPRACADAR